MQDSKQDQVNENAEGLPEGGAEHSVARERILAEADEGHSEPVGFDDPMAQKVDTVGAFLRMVRRRQRLTIPDVEEITKIPKRYIAALEENDVSQFDNRTYALGFVRSYSSMLGLDAEECVRRFRVEFTDQRDPMGILFADREAAETEKQESVRRPLGTLLFVAGLIAFGWYASVNWIAPKHSAAPQAGTYGALSGLSGAEWQSTSGRTATGGPQELVEIDKVPVGLNLLFGSSGADRGEMTRMGNISARHLDRLSRFEPGETFSGSDFSDSASYGGAMFGGALATSRITLKSTDESWVRIETQQNVVLTQQRLEPGDSLIIPDADNITLTVRNAGAVEVLLDGDLVGPLGKDGEVLLAVSLSPESLRF